MKFKTRHRLLFIYQYLINHTDYNHPKSTSDIIRMLRDQHGIFVSKNTIYTDLAILRNNNFQIECVKSTQSKYYYDGYVFEISELRFFIDALISSKSITKCISDSLISKLLTLTMPENAALLRSQYFVDYIHKSTNSSGYYSIDTIHQSIVLQRKISFKYTNYNILKQRYLTNNGKAYTISPYELVQDGDYYYVRGFCDEYQKMLTFRLDHIYEQPQILDEEAVSLQDHPKQKDFRPTVFRMFGSESTTTVKLLCDSSTMKYLIDNFGKDFSSEVLSDQTFMATVSVCISSTFYRWVFGFDGKIKILEPTNVVEAYKIMLQKALLAYK